MRKVNELKAGVILSYINLAIGTIIPLVYTPIMLSILGQAEYGLYSLSNSVIGYLSLLSFGLGSTIIRYISKYRAENNKDMEEKTIGMFIVLYSILALLVILCGIVIYNNVEFFFKKGLTIDEIERMKQLVIIMVFNTAISFPSSVFSSVTTAHEKYIFRKCIDMLSTIGVPIFNIIMLLLGYGSVGMAMASTCIQFIMFAINSSYCFKVLNVKPRFKEMPFNMMKEIAAFSLFVFLGSIVDMLFWATDKVLLGAMVSSAAVAIYNVGGTFNSMMTSLSTSISGVLVPKITKMVFTSESKNEWTELFIRIGRLQFYIVALVVTGFICFGRAAIYFIAGDGYEESYVVALLTMIPLVVPLIQNVGLNILVALNKHKFRSVIYLIIAILNVISTYLVIPYLGVIGAALCSAASYVLGQGLIMNMYYYKVTGINIPLFWKNIIRNSIMPICMTVITLYISTIINFNNPIIFLLGVFIYTFIYCILSYVFNMDDYEKDIVRVPLLKIYRKLVH